MWESWKKVKTKEKESHLVVERLLLFMCIGLHQQQQPVEKKKKPKKTKTFRPLRHIEHQRFQAYSGRFSRRLRNTRFLISSNHISTLNVAQHNKKMPQRHDKELHPCLSIDRCQSSDTFLNDRKLGTNAIAWVGSLKHSFSSANQVKTFRESHCCCCLSISHVS